MRVSGLSLLLWLTIFGIQVGSADESPVGSPSITAGRETLPDDVGELSALREARFAEFAAAANAQQRPEMLRTLQRVVAVDRQLLIGALRDIPGQTNTVNVFRDRFLDSAGSLARLMVAAGEYSNALAVRTELVGVYSARWGEDHWKTQEARLDLSELEQLLKLTPAQRNLLTEAAALNRQVLQLYQQGVPEQALNAAQRACELRRSVLGEAHRDFAASLNNQALLYSSLGRFAEAEANYQKVAEVFRSTLGESHPQYATVSGNLGELYREWGRYSEAEQYYQRALRIDEQAYGKRHPEYATGLNNLGLLYQATGRPAEAVPLLREALEVIGLAQGEQHPHYAAGLSNLAQAVEALADYGQARRLLEQAVELKRSTLGQDHPDYAIGLAALGSLLSRTGDFAAAEAHLRQAVRILEQSVGTDHPTYAHALNHLARLYELIGSYDRAEELFRQCLEIRRRVMGEVHPDFATSLNNLGVLYVGIDRPADAAPLLKQALAIWRAALGEQHPRYAMTLNNLAAATANLGDRKSALALHQQALALQQKRLGDRHPDTAQSLGNLALLHLHAGRYEQAVQLFLQAAEIYREIGGPQHPRYALIVSNLGSTWQLAGDSEQAAKYLGEAYLRTAENLDQTAVVLTEAQQLALTQSVQYRLHTYLSGLLECTGRDAEAYAAVLNWKGATLLRQRATRQAADDPQLASILGELQTVTRHWSTIMRLDSPSRTPEVASRLTALSQQKENLERQLARSSAAYRTSQQSLTLEQLSGALPPETVLVDYFEFWRTIPARESGALHRFERSLAAFVVQRNGSVQMFDLGAIDPISAAIETWRKSFGLGTDGQSAGQTLRARLWQPLRTAIGSARTVLISPDGTLGRLPFAALPGDRPDSYLLEEYRLTMLPVPRLIAEQSGSAAPQPASELRYQLLLVGDVDYDHAGRTSGAESTTFAANQSAPGAGERSTNPSAAQVAWTPLPGTAEEVAAIQKLSASVYASTTEAVAALQRDQATEQAWCELAPRSRRLHLATHGFFAPPDQRSALSPDPQLLTTRSAAAQTDHLWLAPGTAPGLLSGIVFAGANQVPATGEPAAESSPADDGILTADEVAALRLANVELAVLSACETGLGTVAGGEGVLGIQRAFQVAGVATTVSTLWQVDDAVTRKLMEEFYRRMLIEQQSPLDALREAQLWVLRNPQLVEQLIATQANRGDQRLKPAAAGAAPRTPPYYWGAFQLSGEWR